MQPPAPPRSRRFSSLAPRRWLARYTSSLRREMRWSYVPPLLVYFAAGLSGLTTIVTTFFVKDHLGLTAAFVAALGFWAGLPWALKMPVGHLVDLMWARKSAFVYAGAALVALSLGIMVGLLAAPDAMREVMSAEAWFVLSSLLAPVGFVLQDVVADAMTVEAVPRMDDDGRPIDDARRTLMHTTMQTLGRVAAVAGGLAVSLANIHLLGGARSLPPDDRSELYLAVYEAALVIPLLSVSGVWLAAWLHRRGRFGRSQHEAAIQRPPVNWWVLGGGAAFALVSAGVGLSQLRYGPEIVFVASAAILGVLVWRLLGVFDAETRRMLLGTLFIILLYRSTPTPGPGVTWWMIDELGFDPPFFATLSLVSSGLTLAALLAMRRFIAQHSIAFVVAWLSVAHVLLGLPALAMYHGLHEWTAAHTNGVVDARFLAMVDAAETPLGQIALVPMLAWIARWAPENLKATYFAVMASFSNLSIAATQLGTKYLNRVFEVSRDVRDPLTQAVVVSADYSQLGHLLAWSLVIGLLMPLGAILAVRWLGIPRQ
jgi:hypothetical protein